MHRSRRGRRRPYLLFGPLPYALAFTMLWFRPAIESTVLLVAYYAPAYVLYDAAATAIYMPYFALTPELTGDYGGISFWAVVQIVMIVLGSSSPLGLLLFMCVLAGIGVAAAHVLPWSILPDAIEWGELQTGERHEGMFYSLVTLIRKVATSLAVPAVGPVLQFTGYVPNAAQQPPSALLGIRIVIGPIPALLLCAGILFAILYPLGREEYTRLVEELERRRAGIGKEVA